MYVLLRGCVVFRGSYKDPDVPLVNQLLCELSAQAFIMVGLCPVCLDLFSVTGSCVDMMQIFQRLPTVGRVNPNRIQAKACLRIRSDPCIQLQRTSRPRLPRGRASGYPNCL